MGQRLLLAVLLFFLASPLKAQTFVFAHLEGTPVDTAGWNFVGAASLADTRGDADNNRNEVMVVPLQNTFSSGAVFYKKSLDLASCQKFEAEFDYRLFDGNIGPTGADGMAFCFLTEPPRSFIDGGGMGIPPAPTGFIVGMDQWCNCCSNGGAGAQKIEIRYGNGQDNYDECTNQPTAVVTNLRQNGYQHMRIRYDFGQIQVFLGTATVPVLRGTFVVNFPGFFGFTASTGSRVDNHSIRNFVIKTVDPITPPDAGADFRMCSGDTVQLGGQNSNHPNLVYSWYPRVGVENPLIGTTRVTLVNNSPADISQNYFLSKDSLGRLGGQCSSSDVVRITITGTGLNLPQAPINACDGQTFQSAFPAYTGFQYAWDPAAEISNLTIANPQFHLQNTGDTTVVRQFILRARYNGCQRWNSDTLTIRIGPRPRKAGPDLTACSGQPITIGDTNLLRQPYAWSPATGLNNPGFALPTATIINTTAGPQDYFYSVAVSDPATGCIGRDTMRLRVFPLPASQINPAPQACIGNPQALGDFIPRPNHYLWSPGRLLSDSLGRNPILQTAGMPAPSQLVFTVLITDSVSGCQIRDTVTLSIKPLPVANAGPPQDRCAGSSFLLGDVTQPGVVYTWSPVTFLNQTDVSAPRLSLPSDTLGQTLVYQLNALLNGCQARDTVTVTVLPQPVAKILPHAPVCVGDSLHLSAVQRPGNSYLWPLSGNLTGPDIAVPITLAGVTFYQNLIVRGANGCTASDSITVSPNNPPGPLAGPDRDVCPTETVLVGMPVVSGLTYQWAPIPGMSGIASAVAGYTAFAYSEDSALHAWAIVTAKDPSTGCQTVDSVRLTINRAPHRYAGPDHMFCAGSAGWIGADSMPGHRYGWETILFADSAYLHVPLPRDTILRPYEFIRRATLQGCSLYDTVLVNAAPLPAYNPNIFGRPSICPGLATDYHLVNAPTSLVYAWQVDGGILTLHVPRSDTASVQWGTVVRPNASISVVAGLQTDSVFCQGDTVRLNVLINPILRAPLPQGPLCINSQNGQAGYSIQGFPTSSYIWGIQGAAIVAGQGTDSIQVHFTRRGAVRIWIDEQINNTLCAGPSDTILVQVMNTPDDLAGIIGDSTVCPGDTLPYAFGTTFPGSVVHWELADPAANPLGSSSFITETDTAIITFPTSGRGRIIAFEITSVGCTGNGTAFFADSREMPVYTWAAGTDSILCPDDIRHQFYGLTSVGSGISHIWQVEGGAFDLFNFDSSTVYVDWARPGGNLTVQGVYRNGYGCLGPILTLPVLVDSSRIRLAGVSHVDDNNQDLLFRLGIVNPFIINGKDGARMGSIQRLDRTVPGATWQDFAPITVQPGDSRFLVTGQYEPGLQYTFRIATVRACGIPDTSTAVTPIYLRVQGDEASGDVSVHFSPHRGIVQMEFYNLVRSASGGPWETARNLTLTDTMLTLPGDGRLGFENCYRVLGGFEDDGFLLSNRACLDFENFVKVPNVLTPNGDAVNDYLDPETLPLYLGSYQLDITNRWGKSVLSTSSYTGTWPTGTTAPGIYFYHLSYPKGVLKGWIEVAR